MLTFLSVLRTPASALQSQGACPFCFSPRPQIFPLKDLASLWTGPAPGVGGGDRRKPRLMSVACGTIRIGGEGWDLGQKCGRPRLVTTACMSKDCSFLSGSGAGRKSVPSKEKPTGRREPSSGV